MSLRHAVPMEVNVRISFIPSTEEPYVAQALIPLVVLASLLPSGIRVLPFTDRQCFLCPESEDLFCAMMSSVHFMGPRSDAGLIGIVNSTSHDESVLRFPSCLVVLCCLFCQWRINPPNAGSPQRTPLEIGGVDDTLVYPQLY